MKRTTKIAIAIAAVFALCLGLVGCGGGDGADYTKNFTGDWKLSGMTENGEAMSGDDIAFMESFGMTVTLTLNEDGRRHRFARHVRRGYGRFLGAEERD